MDEDNNSSNDNNKNSKKKKNNDNNSSQEKSIYYKSVDVPELYCQIIDLTEEPTTNLSNIEILNYIGELFYYMASDKLENDDNSSENDDEFDEINAEYDEPDIILTGYENKGIIVIFLSFIIILLLILNIIVN